MNVKKRNAGMKYNDEDIEILKAERFIKNIQQITNKRLNKVQKEFILISSPKMSEDIIILKPRNKKGIQA